MANGMTSGSEPANGGDVIAKLIELLGIELVSKILTDDQFFQSIAALCDVVKQLAPEQKQELLAQIQQMGGGAPASEGAEQPQGSAQMFAGEQQRQNVFR